MPAKPPRKPQRPRPEDADVPPVAIDVSGPPRAGEVPARPVAQRSPTPLRYPLGGYTPGHLPPRPRA